MSGTDSTTPSISVGVRVSPNGVPFNCSAGFFVLNVDAPRVPPPRLRSGEGAWRVSASSSRDASRESTSRRLFCGWSWHHIIEGCRKSGIWSRKFQGPLVHIWSIFGPYSVHWPKKPLEVRNIPDTLTPPRRFVHHCARIGYCGNWAVEGNLGWASQWITRWIWSELFWPFQRSFNLKTLELD